MSYYIKNELRRAIFSKPALLTFLITLITMLISFLAIVCNDWNIFNINVNHFKKFYDSVDIFLMARAFGPASILCLIAPLLAALVFSNSYLQDKDSGFLKFIYARMNRKKYIISRIFVNAISSGVIISAALIVILIFISLILGIKTNPNSFFKVTGAYVFWYEKSKWIYVICIIILSFIFNVIFATLSLGLSPFINNKYLSFLCPFFIYILSLTLFCYIRLSSLNMAMLFRPIAIGSEIPVLIYQFVLLVIGIVLFYVGVLYRNEKDL
ncbi:hypothetical protein [Clostridium uliginosum]|uniref:ABC-2 family transporter protein n=1 Tax=Clostridium uliginosum TaxID=119641 RepID=A0A1I1R1C6_9CLOT|nr:hypothetical protein [Clostridium uliginosum]SFD28119.1 hypothetical protein SAMN05421842_12928 [Clostridium uliginosum]